jgi:hypothetical protein
MNSGRIDPLALLAIEADARARAAQETEKWIISRDSKGSSTMQSGPPMMFRLAAPCHPIPICRREAHLYPSNMCHIVYPPMKETHRHLTEPACREGRKLALPPVASTSTRFNVHRSSPLPDISSLGSSSAPTSPAHQKTNRRQTSFALKLHALLADTKCRSAVTWLPAGKSFCILDKEEFTNKWLPKYFGEAKFESFSRRLKRWGFQKMLIAGQSQVVYFHEHFQRDRLDLSKILKGKGRSRSNSCPGEVFDSEQYEISNTEQEIAERMRLAEAHKNSVHNREMRHQLQMTPPPSLSRQVSRAHSRSTFSMGRSASAVMPYHQRDFIDPASINVVGFPSQEERHAMHQQMHACRSIDTSAARELSNLEDDISRCQEQLAILNRLKMLKEQYYAFRV